MQKCVVTWCLESNGWLNSFTAFAAGWITICLHSMKHSAYTAILDAAIISLLDTFFFFIFVLICKVYFKLFI